jgi:hypothetical protein
MEVTVQIPDDIASRMTVDGGDLSRLALEALVAEEFRQGRLHKPDLRRLLGFGTSYEIDGFLKAHGVYPDFTMKDLEHDLADLKSLVSNPCGWSSPILVDRLQVTASG